MRRLLEKEIMEDGEACLAYAKANISMSNKLFVDKLLKNFRKKLGNIIDIGCGTCDIPISIAENAPDARIVAVDASKFMLELAKEKIIARRLEQRITTINSKVPGLAILQGFDMIISNSFIHHLPDPLIFWKEIKLIASPNAGILFMDLIRPDSKKHAQQLVQNLAPQEHRLFKRDFYNSLLSSFTLTEIQEQLEKNSLSNLRSEVISEHYWIVYGFL